MTTVLPQADRRKTIRLRHIEVFYAVYTSGSVTSAARMLNVSQPSVSKVLAHAEQQLDFPLFERARGKLTPTPEAHRLFKHVSDVYQHVDRLRHLAKNLRTADTGRVRIACTPAFGLEIVPQAVARFRESHPGVVFDIATLHLDEINSALLDSRIDLGLAFDPISHPGIEQEPIGNGRFVVIAPADSYFPGATEVSLDDLAGKPFIGLNRRGPLGRLLSSHLESSNVGPDVVGWTETYHVAKSLVAFGAGITITDEITARASVGRTVRILPLKPSLEFEVRALRLGSAPLSLTAANFLEELRHSVAAVLTADDGA